MAGAELFIGPRLESSNWYCDDFMGKLVGTKKETPVIIRHFHTRNATLKPDSTIEWIETTDPSNRRQKSVMKSLLEIHEKLKHCPYVQKEIKVPQLPPDIHVFDAIRQDHVLNSQDLPWFLFMLLSCLEVAHAQKIYHGQICKKNISWYVNPTDGVTRVLLGNWLDAAIRKSMDENDTGDAQKMVQQDLANLKQVAKSLFPDEVSIRTIEEWFGDNPPTATYVKGVIVDPDFEKK